MMKSLRLCGHHPAEVAAWSAAAWTSYHAAGYSAAKETIQQRTLAFAFTQHSDMAVINIVSGFQAA